jgi:hypothetical protein
MGEQHKLRRQLGQTCLPAAQHERQQHYCKVEGDEQVSAVPLGPYPPGKHQQSQRAPKRRKQQVAADQRIAADKQRRLHEGEREGEGTQQRSGHPLRHSTRWLALSRRSHALTVRRAPRRRNPHRPLARLATAARLCFSLCR